MALRGHHLGHGAGHWPCAALCSATDERPAEHLLRLYLAVHGGLSLEIAFWTDPDLC